jgi:hypothetical protein
MKLTDKRLKNLMIGFISLFFKIIIDRIEEIDQEIIGILLFIASKLSKQNITGEIL